MKCEHTYNYNDNGQPAGNEFNINLFKFILNVRSSETTRYTPYIRVKI